ncbi:MAG TPA: hypothetical protein VI299_24420, partial [Polyangiales bacterium]
MRNRLIATLSVLVGCSATTDFDYTYRPSNARDSGQADATSDGDAAPDLDATSQDGEAGSEDADTGTEDAGCTTCCMLVETTEQTCTGNRDEDCDGKADCNDSDCRQAPNCCPNPTVESGTTACTDKIDNDCDGLPDCQDMGCKGVYECNCGPVMAENGSFPASCTDGNDNDCDHLIDCQENDCALSPQCCTPTSGQESVETSCSDGINNDCDVAGTDCADPDCRMSTDAGMQSANETGSQCTDRVDNDCDGQADCTDSDCRGTLDCCVKTTG